MFESIFHCNRFSLLFNNFYSFNQNYDAYLQSYFFKSGFMLKIIFFCETKCTPGSEKLYSVPGYKSVFRNKTSNSGGLALYINDSVLFRVSDYFKFLYSLWDTLFFEVTINNTHVIYVGVCRRPRSSIEEFMYDCRKIIHEIRDGKACFYDEFNLELLQNETCHSVYSFVD